MDPAHTADRTAALKDTPRATERFRRRRRLCQRLALGDGDGERRDEVDEAGPRVEVSSEEGSSGVAAVAAAAAAPPRRSGGAMVFGAGEAASARGRGGQDEMELFADKRQADTHHAHDREERE